MTHKRPRIVVRPLRHDSHELLLRTCDVECGPHKFTLRVRYDPATGYARIAIIPETLDTIHKISVEPMGTGRA